MKTILVLGGKGKTGRRIARRLESAGQHVRTASRTGSDVHLDLDSPTTWAPVIDGVTAAYLVEPDLQAAIDRPMRIPALVSEAVAAGVRRLVFLSAPGVETDDTHPLKAAEQSVRDSGVEWTILRPTWFSQNFSEASFLPGILAGTLALPTGDGRTPFIDAEDIAEVAAAALTDGRHSGQIYELTGPRAISFGEAADLIGKATGRTIRHLDIDPEAFIDRQVANGTPIAIARLLTDLFIEIRNGSAAALSDGVQRALGRPARSFEDYVLQTATTGRWN